MLPCSVVWEEMIRINVTIMVTVNGNKHNTGNVQVF